MPTPISDVPWIHGADCATNADPLQVYQFDPDTFIFRENKCYSAEGNFMYLLLGASRAILFDSGARQDKNSPLPKQDLPIADAVERILQRRKGERGQASFELTVAHTHSHLDHIAWDCKFRDAPQTTVVKYDTGAIMDKFGLPSWPDSQAIFDLGGRELIIFPIPGHEEHHIAAYDRNTRILLTGDMLYPGILTVDNWTQYRASAATLDRFVSEHPVSFVLGAHIEMTNTPRRYYQPETPIQCEEHALPLGVQHVRELHQTCQQIGSAPAPGDYVQDEFVIRIF